MIVKDWEISHEFKFQGGSPPNSFGPKKKDKVEW